MALIKLFVAIVMVHSTVAVLQLTDSNFYNYASKKEVLLVDFMAPWCSDCTRLAPHYEAAAAALGPRAADLAQVDCYGTGKGLCEMYSVKSYPQLKSFHFGNFNGDYTGPQTAADIANYINTVENSASPMSAPEQPAGNPYAGHNKVAPGYGLAAANKLPAATSIGCAKCKINKPNGKIGKDCTAALKKACIAKTKSTLTKTQEKYGEDD